MSILHVKNLTMRFGGLTAVKEVNFKVADEQIFAIIGPNGAGKTTLFNTVSGIYPPSDGAILFEGKSQMRPVTPLVLVGCLLVGILTGLLALFISVNIDTLWKVMIRENYAKPSDDFSTLKAIKDGFHFILDRKMTAIIGGIVGFLIGFSASFVVWNRSRRTTDSISLGGIARTFQNIRLFQNMTVAENVLVGLDRTFKGNFCHLSLHLPFHKREEAEANAQVSELLAFIGLQGKENQLAKNLPYGEQRKLEIARALACKPRLILLDEPAAGMNPTEKTNLMNLIKQIRDEKKMTILLIEHDMKLVMGISDRIAVLNYGVKIAEGDPHTIQNDPEVIKAYLGES